MTNVICIKDHKQPQAGGGLKTYKKGGKYKLSKFDPALFKKTKQKISDEDKGESKS